MSTTSIPETPTLSQVHSGIPARLLDKARRAKSLIYNSRTKLTAPRTGPQLPVIPQGVSRLTFDRAIQELGNQLGAENVELNDKPSKNDGWYMEHPNTHDMMNVDEDEFVASAVVYPGSTAEV